MNELNIKYVDGLELITSRPLSDEDIRILLSVACALNGVRMDLDRQLILDMVVELFNAGHGFDEIGLAVLGAVLAPAEDVVQ